MLWTTAINVSSFNSRLCFIEEGNGNPLQCSCLENPRDGGAWSAAVYGVTQSPTRLKRLSSSSSSKSLLHILDNRHRYVSFENILSQFVACLVILLILSSPEQKFLIVMKLSFFIIYFMDYVFSVISKGLPRWLSGKESLANAGDSGNVGDAGSIPGWGTRISHACVTWPKINK